MSVNDTTPERRPERWAPGKAEAGIEPKLAPGAGDWGAEPVLGTKTAAVCDGVAKVAGEGDDDPSTTHIR